MTDRVIASRVASTRWLRVEAGVYRLAGVRVTWKQRALAACMVSGPEAVVSHRSAAVLWGVSGGPRGSGYPDRRLAIELDGFRWHAGRGPFRSDRLRRNRIEAAGWRLLETAPDDIDALAREAARILRWAA